MATAAELERIRGVGPVLAQRLIDAGLGSYARIVEGGAAALRTVPGVSPRALPSILQQAAQLAQDQGSDPQEAPEDPGAVQIQELRDELNRLALGVRERFAARLSGKKATSLGDDLATSVEALDALGGKKGRKKKRARALEKVQGVVALLESVKLRRVCKGFRKTRKILAKAAKS